MLHWTDGLIIAIVLVTVFAVAVIAVRSQPSGHYFDLTPLFGCFLSVLAFMVGLVLVLVVLLLRAWGCCG